MIWSLTVKMIKKLEGYIDNKSNSEKLDKQFFLLLGLVWGLKIMSGVIKEYMGKTAPTFGLFCFGRPSGSALTP